MRLTHPHLNLTLFHDVHESFSQLLRASFADRSGLIGVALGPIYQKDPADELMFPYIRADVETGWSSRPRFPDGLPEHVITRARELRQAAVDAYVESSPWWDCSSSDEQMIDDWTRAGMVLEVCSRRGVNVRGLGKAHVKWRLKGTETGRFGASHTWNTSSAFPNGFNPLTIPRAERNLIVPSAGGRQVAVIDFKAMDLCSMVKLVPGLALRYRGTFDHDQTARILGVDRDTAKEHVFVHAYGGNSPLRSMFEKLIPELSPVRLYEHGEFARRVQSLSANAFKAGLAKALILLLGDDVIPMFTVHDELVLDVEESAIDKVVAVADALQEGATDRVGVKYSTSLKFGLSYGEAKEQ